LINKHII